MENLLNLDWVSLQLDVFNAFNELDRAIIFQYKYGQAAALHMLNGCPLASMLFALVIHKTILKVQAEVPSLALNVAFLDDWTLTGPIESINSTKPSA
jgi:hypothetical protein